MADKNKDLDLIPAIKPAMDEVASYRRSGRTEAPKQSNFNGVLVFAIVLMGVMMAIGGFALWEVQQRLETSNQLLAKSQERLQELDSRLSESGSTSSQRFQSMESQIKTNVSEIDKLWGVAHRTNRPNIAQNTQSIEALKATATRLDRDLKAATTSMQQVRDSFATLSSDIAQVRQRLLTDNQEAMTQVAMVRGQVQDYSTQAEGTKREVAALDQRLRAVDESIDAFDRYRQQINQRLIDLQTQIQSRSP